MNLFQLKTVKLQAIFLNSKVWLSILALCLLFCNSSLAQRKAALSLSDIDLSWRNFSKKNIGRNVPAAAQTAVNIQLAYEVEDDNLIITLRLRQLKSDSWVSRQFLQRATDAESTRLLNHEKLHYAINLISLRRMYEQMNARNYTDQYQSEITGIFNEHNRWNQQTNSTYDRETRHGTLTEKQEEWEEKILKELNDTYPPEIPIETDYFIYKKLNQ